MNLLLTTQHFILFVFPFILGLIVGSFANVCIHRLPRKESIVFPSSRCPSCHHPLRIRDNLPLISFVLLRGRCKFCKDKISWRYPLVELLTGILYMTIVTRFQFSPSTPIYLALVTVLIIISFIDLQEKIIPDELSIPGVGAGLIFSSFVLPVGFLNALMGMVVGGGILLIVALISRGGMGGGDVKLMAMLGAFVGWPDVVVSLFLAVFIGSVVGLVLIVLGIKKRKDTLPFGPFLALGAIVSILYGADLIIWYLNFGWGL